MKKVFKQIIIGIIIAIITVIITIILRENFFKFDKKLSKENKKTIEQYITDINNSNSPSSMTFLSTYYFGDRYNDDILKVYLWVMYDEYNDTTNSFEHSFGISLPYVIIINTSDDKFEITDYEKVDLDKNTKSLNELVPIAIRGKVKSFTDNKEFDKLQEEHNNLVEIYQEYFKGE